MRGVCIHRLNIKWFAPVNERNLGGLNPVSLRNTISAACRPDRVALVGDILHVELAHEEHG